jgi:hypothetical protein
MRVRPLRFFALLGVIVALLGVALPTSAAQHDELDNADELEELVEAVFESEAPAVPGVTWTSPNYPWSLTYDDPWRIVEEDTSGSSDYLALNTDYSGVYFVTSPADPGLSALDCVAGMIEIVKGFPDVVEVKLLENGPISGDDDRAAAAATVRYDIYDSSTGELRDPVDALRVNYLECRTLVPDEAVLLIFHDAFVNNYNPEIYDRQVLLASVAIDGQRSSPMPSPESADDTGPSDSGGGGDAEYACPPDQDLIDGWREDADELRELARDPNTPSTSRASFLDQAAEFDRMADDWISYCASHPDA